MSTRFFLVFVSLCWSATYADPQTREQKQVAKDCAGVSPERLDALREFVARQPKDASHGRVVTAARAWAKPAKDEVAIPDGCVAAVVRAALTLEGRTKEQLEAEAWAKREALARFDWEQLSRAEQLWVIRFRATGKPPIIWRSLKVGEIGEFADDVILSIIDILSESSLIADVDSTHCQYDICLNSDGALFTKVNTFGVVTGARQKPKGVYLVVGTVTYPTAAGGSRTVYEVEQIALDTEKLKQIVPPTDAIAKAPKAHGEPPPVSAGSGFLIGRALVVTNYHVIREAQSIRCFVSDAPFDASVIARDKENDVVLLRLEKEPPSVLPVLEIGDSGKIAQGERVYAMGYPLTDVLGKELHVHEGIVSSVVGFEGRASEFQVGMSVNPGNSGGPLLDGAGRVVGIIASKLSLGYAIQTGTIPEGVTFAIKADLLRSLVSTAGVSGEVQFDATTRTPTTLEDLTSTFGKAVVRVEVNR